MHTFVVNAWMLYTRVQTISLRRRGTARRMMHTDDGLPLWVFMLPIALHPQSSMASPFGMVLPFVVPIDYKHNLHHYKPHVFQEKELQSGLKTCLLHPACSKPKPK